MEAKMKTRERYYDSYKDETTKKFGLRDKETGEIIIEASTKNGFTSLIPSRRNTQQDLPIVATYNKYGDNGVIIRGVVILKGSNDFEEINLPDTYNFIDGFDGGFARVYKTIGGKKVWGIIGLRKNGEKLEIKECVAPQYDNIGRFYDNLRTSVPVEKDGLTKDISLVSLKESARGDDFGIEFSDDGSQVMLKGTDFESVSSGQINGVLYSVGHAKGKVYDFGVIDHTNKRVVLPFVFNHITLGMQTQPLIVSANYHGRWYVLKPNGKDFKIEDIESETTVDSHRYTLIDGFDHGLARVRINESWGIINIEGTEVLPVEYQNIWNFYGKNRAYTNVIQNGKAQQFWFKDLAAKDSMTSFDGSKLEKLPYMPKLNSIGMEKFKRFKDYTEIQFKDINFFVGPNNAGKSTSIKALILLSCNLKKLRIEFMTKVKDASVERMAFLPFDFAPQEYPYLNTNSYVHCVNRLKKGLTIMLSMSFGKCDFKINIDQDSNIDLLTIFSHSTNLKIIIHNNFVKLCLDDTLLSEYQIRDNGNINTSLRGVDLLNVIIDGFTNVADNIKDNLKVLRNDIQDSINGFGYVQHIPIYSASRDAILNRYNNNDLSAMTAKTYIDLRDYQKDFAKKFMIKWMNPDHFNIGSDFRIETIKERNTLLTIEIKDADETWVDLCDMGTGANHLFILLLSISDLIGEHALSPDMRTIVTIEEPEMNLHPNYQSMVTEMLEDANNYARDLAKRYFSANYVMTDDQINNLGFQFVVETHSEYTIRKSQLRVAEEMYPDEEKMSNNNPFKIIYYPQKGTPYDMGWDIFGRFINFFDEGFFDVASNDALAVSELEWSRK